MYMYANNGYLLIISQDLSKLVSRKVDWDLKRGIEKNLAILQDRTNEVIAEIVQESMGSDEEEDD